MNQRDRYLALRVCVCVCGGGGGGDKSEICKLAADAIFDYILIQEGMIGRLGAARTRRGSQNAAP